VLLAVVLTTDLTRVRAMARVAAIPVPAAPDEGFFNLERMVGAPRTVDIVASPVVARWPSS
jgi:hypothetical protein